MAASLANRDDLGFSKLSPSPARLAIPGGAGQSPRFYERRQMARPRRQNPPL
jgi:hypothetical protein